MMHLRHTRARGLIIGFFGCALPFIAVAGAEPSDDELLSLLKGAERILSLAKNDPVAAGKESSAVFKAAHALREKGRLREALDYFQEGLRLSPWSLEEQIAMAGLLRDQKRGTEAEEIAHMVLGRAETDALANAARALLGQPPVAAPSVLDGSPEKTWLCFVKVGQVSNIMLGESMAKMSRTLGLPARLLDETVGLPRADRSAFNRWVQKSIIPGIQWSSAPAMQLLESLDATRPEDVPPRKLVSALIRSFELDGMRKEADDLRQTAAFYQKTDQQWEASGLLSVLENALAQRRDLRHAIVVGITSADLYANDSNYLFGVAHTGGRKCLVSCARFQADLYGDPPDRTRLVTRLHKQLLSSIGFSLDVPRPIDPTSARAYPASLGEHDAKSEYMSPACITGFERALGQPLPPEARPPERR
jgi:predicted Zn-dependent protease